MTPSPALVMRTDSPDRTLKGEPEITRDRHPETPGTVVVQPRSPAHTNGKRWGQDSPGAAPHHAPRSVWVALQMDWARRASRPDAHQHVAIWTQAAPQLDGFASPAEILDAVGCLGHPEQSCRLLSGLLLAAHHDALAAYAVLVALIPGLRVAAGRRWQTARGDGPWTSRDELDTDTISAAWQAIAAHAGERHARPARLIIRAAERHLRTSHDAYRRRSARTLPQGNLNNTTTMSLADQAGADPLALALVESARSGRLDPASFDIAYRVALLDEDPSTAGSRHGLDHRQTRATLRSALDALAGDHRRTSFPEPRSRSINPAHSSGGPTHDSPSPTLRPTSGSSLGVTRRAAAADRQPGSRTPGHGPIHHLRAHR